MGGRGGPVLRGDGDPPSVANQDPAGVAHALLGLVAGAPRSTTQVKIGSVVSLSRVCLFECRWIETG